jgi:hypothetical protein
LKSVEMQTSKLLISIGNLCHQPWSSGTTGLPGSEAACSRPPGHQTVPFWWRHIDRETFT